MDAIIQPFLRRSDTERPKLTSSISSPNKSSVNGAGVGDQLQITQLVEALNAAKKELEAHNTKLKEVEDMLAQERQARESAEERAHRLEMERKDSKASSPEHENQNPAEMNGSVFAKSSESIPEIDKSFDPLQTATPSEDPSTKLQQRLDHVLGEMNQMKTDMEKYRTRAEKAEEASTRDRKTLAEMIEKVRQDEEKRAAQTASRGRRSRSTSTFDSSATTLDGTEESFAEISAKTEKGQEEVPELFRKVGMQNGRPVTPEQMKQLQATFDQALATRRRRGEQMAQIMPFASIVGVVVAGVTLMAYLNGLQKVER